MGVIKNWWVVNRWVKNLSNVFLQPCENEKTPLMRAAQNGADETVRELLRWGASTRKVARARLYFDPCKIGTGLNALGFAVLSKCHSTITLLASMTDTGLEGLLYLLCSEQMEVTQPLEELIKRLSGTDKGAAIAGLRYASIFGHTHLVKLLSQGRELPELFIQQLLEEAVRSDNHETCAATLPLLKGKMPRPEVIAVARERGRSSLVQLLAPESYNKDKIAQAKAQLKQDIQTKAAENMRAIPKSREFKYNYEMGRFRPLLEYKSHVTFEALLEALHMPPTHTESECPEDCQQSSQCSMLRETYHLVRIIVATMGKINPIFNLGKDRHPSLVGSLKEGTRCFFLDELDVHVSLNKRLRKFCFFDVEKQQLKIDNDLVTDDVKRYVKGDVFDCEAFFNDFIETLVEAIQMIDLSLGFFIEDKHHKFTMCPLKLDYNPCLRCMDLAEHERPQVRRCRHSVDCAAHHKEGLPECRNNCNDVCNYFSHEKTCQCQEFTSPCLTMTKIGAALHLQFLDGSRVDCDINVPTIPTSTYFDGAVDKVQDYLERNKPVGWLEELSKLEDHHPAAAMPHLIEAQSWQVKMRRVNSHTVLPRQVSVNRGQ